VRRHPASREARWSPQLVRTKGRVEPGRSTAAASTTARSAGVHRL
jgi:hypothetical protein